MNFIFQIVCSITQLHTLVGLEIINFNFGFLYSNLERTNLSFETSNWWN